MLEAECFPSKKHRFHVFLFTSRQWLCFCCCPQVAQGGCWSDQQPSAECRAGTAPGARSALDVALPLPPKAACAWKRFGEQTTSFVSRQTGLKTKRWAQHFSSPGLLGSCYKPCVQHAGLSVVGDQVILKLCRNKSTSTLQILPAAFHKGHFYIKHLFAYVVATGDNVQKENKYIS